MSDFNEALELVLNHEGGFTNDPDDPGGPTNWGLIESDLTPSLGRPATSDDIKNLTVDQAGVIYKARYWNPLLLDEVTNTKIASIIFDLGVLRGINSVTKDFQSIIGVDEDGEMGPKTIAAINTYDPTMLVIRLMEISEDHFITRVTGNAVMVKFLPGWSSRVFSNLRYFFGLPWRI